MADLLQLPAWAGIRGLRHGFTGRSGGVSQAYGPGELNLGFTKEDDLAAVRANRAALLAEIGGPDLTGSELAGSELAMVRQVHSATVVRVRPGFGQGLVEADGMVTDAPGIFLAVQAADCVPVLIADPAHRAAGAFHAGWRGTAASIVRAGIECMVREFGSRPEDMLVTIGPSIGPCCYAVGGELLDQFAPDLFLLRDGKTHLDLWQANHRQALEAGVPSANVQVAAECTACTLQNGVRRYFSHRADLGRTGRGVGVSGWV